MTSTQTETKTESLTPATLKLEPQLEFKPIHKFFGAECRGVDFYKPVPKDVMDVVREQLGKYGVLVFRNTGLSDEQYIALANEFGELADSPPVRRFDGPRGLGDPSNIYLDGSIVVPGDLKWFMAKETLVNLRHLLVVCGHADEADETVVCFTSILHMMRDGSDIPPSSLESSHRPVTEVQPSSAIPVLPMKSWTTRPSERSRIKLETTHISIHVESPCLTFRHSPHWIRRIIQ